MSRSLRRFSRFLERDGTDETRNCRDGRRRPKDGLCGVESVVLVPLVCEMEGLAVDGGFSCMSLGDGGDATGTLHRPGS